MLTLCYSWKIFQRICGTAEKRDSGLVQSIRMGGIRRLKENWSTCVNILRKFALPYIFKTSNDGFLVSNNDFKNIPPLLSWQKRLKLD